MNKIIAVGVHRTGTTSLRRALNILGFRCLEFDGCWFMSRLDDQGNLAFQRSPELDSYTAYADFPVPLFFRELDKLFPGSKFILTHRDVEQWVNSVEYIFSAWWNSWITSADWPLIQACHKTFYGTDRFDRSSAIQAYARHNENVRTYFKTHPDVLLDLDMTGDVGWTALCDFLETPVPPVPFPHLNPSVASR